MGAIATSPPPPPLQIRYWFDITFPSDDPHKPQGSTTYLCVVYKYSKSHEIGTLLVWLLFNTTEKLNKTSYCRIRCGSRHYTTNGTIRKQIY